MKFTKLLIIYLFIASVLFTSIYVIQNHAVISEIANTSDVFITKIENVTEVKDVLSETEKYIGIQNTPENRLHKRIFIPTVSKYNQITDIDEINISQYKFYIDISSDIDFETLSIQIYSRFNIYIAKYDESKDNSSNANYNIIFKNIDKLLEVDKIVSIYGIYPLDEGYYKYIFEINGDFQKKDFDIKDISTVVNTGVLANTRLQLINSKNTKNYKFLSNEINNLLKKADIAHTSNEVSYQENCKYSNTLFCSDYKFFDALIDIGVDVVEVTGNHNNDVGYLANTKTLQKYKDNSIDYFGGGLNEIDASKILYKDLPNGTKIAFLGYNYYDTMNKTNALAKGMNPGANSFDFAKIHKNIEDARKNNAYIIVDIQYQECYSYPKNSDVWYADCYKPLSTPNQSQDFRKIIDLGADMVIGTQAHQPQTYEYYNGKPIFYGLGNLSFDQYQWLGTRQSLILKHYFYKGINLDTKIIPTVYDSDFITEIMDKKTKKILLEELVKARASIN